MPGVLIDAMSSPTATADEAVKPSDKRRSGRVSKRPEFLGASHPANSKRKRGHAEDGAEVEDGGSSGSDEDEEDAEDDEPDEEELREERRAKKSKSTPKRPAAKKAKTNGAPLRMPIRSTAQKARPSKKRAVAGTVPDADQAGGLYAEIFASDKSVEEVVSEWVQRFDEHESAALAEIVNFVLRCCGCESEVTNYDVEDVDSANNKLGDLQEEFQAQNVTDYPIILRTKAGITLKHTMEEFFKILIKTIDAADIIFTRVELIENVQVWLSTMSAAQNRPFRHTATVASLAVIDALCDIGRDCATTAATAKRQGENMRKGKGANKKRASGLDKDAEKAKQKQTFVDTAVKDWFDTIYIHRYRDIDPKIRVDCAEALGRWITTYPDEFFDAAHLRYLGWVLSDTNSHARHEVLKSLIKLYEQKDRLAGLKVFTERFRERIVEMAALDSETSVRASAIKLLNLLRSAGYLEPDDIDMVGRLIFDADQRVREAVVPFFTASHGDIYESKVEDLGGEDTIDEEMGDVAKSNDRPGLPWLKLKCLAEVLEAYDAFDPKMSKHTVQGSSGQFRLHAEEVESRFVTVGESLYHDTDIIQDWETLAKYLLYDTSEGAQNGSADGTAAQLKEFCKLSAREEYVLLELLNVSIRQHVTELLEASAERKGKKTKRQREDLADEQESSAREIANLIPQLLKRFGDSPDTALAVLRLERIVDLNALSEIYKTVLDDIEKQFLTHGNEEVMTEASRALLRARTYDELGDETEEKIEELWEETLDTFRRLCASIDPSARGGQPPNVLDGLTKTVYRLERLSSISNPTQHLSAVPEAPKTKSRGKQPAQVSALELLTALARRAAINEDTQGDRATAQAEDALSSHAAQTLGFHVLWTTSTIVKGLPSSPPESQSSHLLTIRASLISTLTSILDHRSPSSPIAAELSHILLDLHSSAAHLRSLNSLTLTMSATTQSLILRVLTACERRLAAKTGKHIDAPREPAPRKRRPRPRAQDDDEMDDAALAASPVASDDEAEPQERETSAPPSLISDSSSSSESDAEEEADEMRSARRAARHQGAALVAEQRLCELGGKMVLAVAAGAVADEKAVSKRLELNRAKLGANWREVVKYLDNLKEAGKKVGGKGAKKKEKEKAVEVESESSENEVEEAEGEGEGEGEEQEQVEEEEEEREAEVESVLGD
ncbi:STAG-domain-containing protein [Myriangium duriaei CBS 260.36]|uniref:STAG-domain-containing protein n=1 Tax=Myriangium duriaei CBS 260.36 TaxID=1168546 RepID=A0A9P4IUU4_9PEZI|nr:STAG-domain-containing protein [Myriangium duriaei CBS 260.36]